MVQFGKVIQELMINMLEKCLCWPCCTFWKNLLGPVTEKLSLFFLSCQCLPLKLSVKIYELVLLIYHHIFSLCNWRTEGSLVALIKENNKAGILIKKGAFFWNAFSTHSPQIVQLGLWNSWLTTSKKSFLLIVTFINGASFLHKWMNVLPRIGLP